MKTQADYDDTRTVANRNRSASNAKDYAKACRILTRDALAKKEKPRPNPELDPATAEAIRKERNQR